MRNETDHELKPSRWLARAREQSQALAEARAQKTSPPGVRVPLRSRPFARHSLAWAALMTLAMVLVGSGAWALVMRLEHASRPPAPIAPPRPRAIVKPPSPPWIVTSPRTAVPPAPLVKRKHRPHAPEPIVPAPTPPPTQALERGDGEFIIVPPEHEPEPPLFSPAEWKRAHEPPDPPR